MPLIDHTLFGTVDKVSIAIQRLKTFEPSEGYYLAFSGGKDSVAVKALLDMAGAKYDAHYSLTSCDPPELVKFIKQKHQDVEIKHPETTMWKLIPKKLMPPTRMVRYCCDVLKEQGGAGRIVVTGVRRAESTKRSQRKLVESCSKGKQKTYFNPIVDWAEEDVWEFIHKYNIPYCSLYDEGFTRLGCVGCPMTSTQKRMKEFERFPKFKDAYIRAFDRMIEERKRREKTTQWETGEEVMEWWLEIGKGKDDGIGYCDDDQTVMFE